MLQLHDSRSIAPQVPQEPIAKKIWTVWSFYCYDDGEDVDLWAAWYKGVDDRTQAAHDQRLDTLVQRQAHEWREPLTRNMDDGLIEIKIKGSLEWRILGYYGPAGQRHAFTILCICYHKQRRYYPPDAIKTARQRMRLIEIGKGKVRPCDRPQ